MHISNYTGSGSTLTVEAWVYARSAIQWENIAANWGSGSTGEFHFGIHENATSIGVRISESDEGIVDIFEPDAFPLNTWQHVAFVADGDSLYLYRNGIVVAGPVDYDNTLKNTFNYLALGAKSDDSGGNAGYTWDGKIDEVRIWSDARTLSEIRANMYKELTGSETNLVAYYKLNENSGTTAVNAVGTSSLDGTLTDMDGATDWVTASAFFGPHLALDFDGADDFVDCGSSNELNITGTAISVEAWIYPRSFPTNSWESTILGNDTEPASGYVLRFGGSGVLSFVYGDGDWNTEALSSNNALSLDTWQHVAAIYDGANIKLYIDGIENSSTANSDPINTSSSSFKIGQSGLGGRWMNGKIDEVRIWNNVRTQTEIRENMCKTLIGNEANLVAYYKMDNSDSTIVTDFSANANDGTLTNMDEATDWVTSTAFNTWLNTDDATWTETTNWSLGTAPSSTDNIGIYSYSGGTNASLPTVTVKNITLGASSTMDLGTNTFTVSGNSTLFGTVNISSGTIDIAGNFDATGGSIPFSDAGNLKVSGTVTSMGTLSTTNGTVTYDGGVQDVATGSYYHLSLSGGTKILGGNITVNGNLSNAADATLDMNNHDVTIKGNLTLESGAGWTKGSGTTTFNSSTSQTLTDNNATAKNLGTVVVD